MFDKKTILLLSGVAAVVLLILFWVNQKNGNQYNWRETYDITSKEPYGSYAIHQLMASYFPNREFQTLNTDIAQSLPKKTDEVSNFIFIGNGMNLDTARAERLLQFVENGNTAFLITEAIPADFFTNFVNLGECDRLVQNYSYDSFRSVWDSTVTLSMNHPNLTAKNEYNLVKNHKVREKDWHYIAWDWDCQEVIEEEEAIEEEEETTSDVEEEEDFEEAEEEAVAVEEEPSYEEAVEEVVEVEEYDEITYAHDRQNDLNYLVLGYLNDNNNSYYEDNKKVNFVRIPHGDGFFYIHTTPLAFTNYLLKDKKNWAYANQVLAHLPEGDIYWDNFSNETYPSLISETGEQQQQQNPWTGGRAKFSEQTPLQFILSERSFTWAWYLLLATAGLFLLFQAKRKQRIIPVITANANTSLEFIETIGMLHWQQNDHRQLALQQMKLLLQHIRNRYHIKFADTENEEQLERLATVSELPKAHLTDIFEAHLQIEKETKISAEHLIHFHKLVDYFYKNCK